MVGYETQTINLYSVSLWDALKFEILNVQEEDLAEESLKALSLIGAKFAQSEGPLDAYLRPIIKECNEHLEDAPTKQSEAAGRILHAIASSAVTVADKIAKGVLPTLFSLYGASESIMKRRGLLEDFNHIVKAYIDLAASQTKIEVEPLQAFSSDALGVMLRALTHAPKAEVSFRLTALRGIAQLLAVRNLLSQDESYQAVDAVSGVTLQEQLKGHADIRSEAMKALTEMAHSSPDAIRIRTIPAFMVELPDVPPGESNYATVLEAFTQLSSEQQVFDTVVLRLKNKLNAARAQGAPREYQWALLLALLYAFTYGRPMPDEDGILRSSYFTDYAEPFISTMQDDRGTDQDPRTLEIIGCVCNIILRPQRLHFQSMAYSKYLDWMSSTRSNAIEYTTPHRNIAPFSLYYYAALRPEVIEPEDIVSLLHAQADYALNAPKDPGTTAALQHISLIINKFINPKAMQLTLTNAKIEIEPMISNNPSPQSISVAFAVVKGLLVQGKCAALTTRYLQILLQLLSSSDKSVARRFANILTPDDILTKENHCLISGLYKQKVFNQLVPSIIDAVRTADTSTKPNYLIALSGILRWLPYSMIESSLSSLIAPLLQTLDLTDAAEQEVKASTLTIFESVLMHDPSIVSEHASSLITRLLNSTAGPANMAKVRAKALQSLALVPRQLKREVVMPYRRQVVKKLMACLDDPKRDVRAEAVKCRTAWLGVDEADEEED